MKSCVKPNKKKRNIKYGKLETAFRKAGYNMTTFAEEIGVNKSTVSDWCMNKYCPSEDNLKKIVDVLNKVQEETLYDIPYFRGDFESKNIENYEIFKSLGILDEAIDGLKKLKKQQEEYLKCDDDRLKSLYGIYQHGFSYMDIVSYIIADTELWETILYEAENVMAWHTSDNYRCRFEELLNEDGEGNKLPNQIEPKDISNQIIAKAISKSFNSYISTKLNELHIKELTAEEHEGEKYKQLKNKK